MKPYYEQSGITIYHGDCRVVLPRLNDTDHVITDPPFGIGFDRYDSHDDDPEEYADLMRWLVSETKRIVKPGGFVFVWQGMLRAGDWHRWFPSEYRIFAAAKNFVQYRPTAFQFSWDPVVFYTNGKNVRKGVAGVRDFHIGNTSKYVAEKSIGHPCPRPIDTVGYIVTAASDPGETILDPFVGSGTTLVAAKRLCRKAIGIEIEERYCEIAAKRLQQEALPFEVA